MNPFMLCHQGEVGLPGPPGVDGEKVIHFFFLFMYNQLIINLDLRFNTSGVLNWTVECANE